MWFFSFGLIKYRSNKNIYCWLISFLIEILDKFLDNLILLSSPGRILHLRFYHNKPLIFQNLCLNPQNFWDLLPIIIILTGKKPTELNQFNLLWKRALPCNIILFWKVKLQYFLSASSSICRQPKRVIACHNYAISFCSRFLFSCISNNTFCTITKHQNND